MSSSIYDYTVVHAVRLVFHDGRPDFIESRCSFAGMDGPCFRVSYRLGERESCDYRHLFWPLTEIREAEVTVRVEHPVDRQEAQN